MGRKGRDTFIADFTLKIERETGERFSASDIRRHTPGDETRADTDAPHAIVFVTFGDRIGISPVNLFLLFKVNHH
jgi:hypothetical protein